MDGKGRTGSGGGEADRCECPGRDCRRTDPVRVQTRADRSQKSQTKHGRIIRAIIQPGSRSAHCVSLCPFCLEGQQSTLSFSPKLNSLNMLLCCFFFGFFQLHGSSTEYDLLKWQHCSGTARFQRIKNQN